ncbi:MAG: aminotransferase class V-fold PLP-dependent enzyme [Planctomycetota bacterium]|jgi:cysteine desulfurase family protein
MQRVYMDNSATSFPKPPAVTEAMVRFAAECGASAGRGGYAEARQCERILAECRSRVARLINAESPERIVFAMNCSEALAIAIRGLLNTAAPGTHAIATAVEHNSVLRPLNALAEQIQLSPQFIPCDPRTGLVDPDDIRAAICPETKLIACVHVSNVTGTIQPVAEVTAIARAAGAASVIDSAQAVGHVELDVQQLGADFVAFPGHKGLMGPLGTGVLYIRPGAEAWLTTMKEGGTGTISEQPVQPETMPDRFEIGSHNAIGLAGLSEGVEWIAHRGVEALREHDRVLSKRFLAGVAEVPGLTVYGPDNLADRTGVFSVNVAGLSPTELAGALERQFGVLTRPGVHCAPLAHQTIGTHPTGTCRLSFGPFTTVDDVDYAATALGATARKAAVGVN